LILKTGEPLRKRTSQRVQLYQPFEVFIELGVEVLSGTPLWAAGK